MYDSAIADLKDAFGDVQVRHQGEMCFVRLASCRLPAGCKPATTAVLLRLVGQNRPGIYVEPDIVGPHGGVPRNYNPELVEGEAWMTFSYSFPWAWDDGLLRFVGAALRRFEKHE